MRNNQIEKRDTPSLKDACDRQSSKSTRDRDYVLDDQWPATRFEKSNEQQRLCRRSERSYEWPVQCEPSINITFFFFNTKNTDKPSDYSHNQRGAINGFIEQRTNTTESETR